MKKGIFPILRDETHTTDAATTWGDDTTKEVGVIKIAGNHAVDFDGVNYPGKAGDCVLVVNTHSVAVNVSISPDPFGDADMDVLSLVKGNTVTVLYHPVNGWIFLSSMRVVDATA